MVYKRCCNIVLSSTGRKRIEYKLSALPNQENPKKMLCRNPLCGIYRSTYDPDYDAGRTECVFCGSTLKMKGVDVLEGGLGGLVKEKRKEQIDYVKVIDDQFEKRHSITFIEGGTGVGKSFAYLVPVMQELLRDRRARAVICTGNKGLQAQLMRDFPRILEAIGAQDVITYALVKGKNNYACPNLLSEVPDEFKQTFAEFTKRLPADKDNWPTEEKLAWWSKASAEECPMPKCGRLCVPTGGKDARVVILNYHYFGFFLQYPFILMNLKANKDNEDREEDFTLEEYEFEHFMSREEQEKEKKKNRPYFKYLVMDEAHQAATFIRSALKLSINPNYLDKLASELDDTEFGNLLLSVNRGDIYDTIHYKDYEGGDDIVKILREGAKKFRRIMDEEDGRTGKSPPTKGKHKYTFTAKKLEGPKEYLDYFNLTKQVIEVLRTISSELGLIHIDRTILDNNPKGCKVKSRAQTKLKRIIDVYYQCQIEGIEDTHLIALEPTGFSITPIEIGKLIRPKLDRLFKHVVVTSATLAQEGNNFDFVREQLGYNNPEDVVVEKVVGSPFKYSECARLYAPLLPELPSNNNLTPWYDAIAKEIVSLAKASKGDGFVLFSSTRDMEAIQERTEYELFEAGIPVITQQEGTTSAACQRAYLETPGSMLYGLRSFWEGVDVQGKKLRLVIVPKLPFPVPDDPILRALTEKSGGGFNGFQKVSVPVMLDTLRQGVGRLIRSKRDMGVIAILDSRFWSGTSNVDKHHAAIRSLQNSNKKLPRGYGRQIYYSLGLIVIDSQDYACKICSTIYDAMHAPKQKEHKDGSSEG